MKNSRGFLLMLAIAVAVSGCEPRDESPGLWLRGEVDRDPVEDWAFARDIEEIFVETRPWYLIPHSTTIWCVELNGDLYVGSYGDERKVWEQNVASDPRAELSIAGKLYPVTLRPLTIRAQIEAVDSAYAGKYDMAEVFGDELPTWRYYHVSPDL